MRLSPSLGPLSSVFFSSCIIYHLQRELPIGGVDCFKFVVSGAVLVFRCGVGQGFMGPLLVVKRELRADGFTGVGHAVNTCTPCCYHYIWPNRSLPLNTVNLIYGKAPCWIHHSYCWMFPELAVRSLQNDENKVVLEIYP